MVEIFNKEALEALDDHSEAKEMAHGPLTRMTSIRPLAEVIIIARAN